MKTPLSSLALAGLCFLGAGAALPTAASSDWPGLRGPNGRGIYADDDLPLRWSATENVLWQVEIPGRGHSSPIVSGNRLFLTTAIRGDRVDGHQPITHIIEGDVFLHPDSVDGDHTHEYRVLAIEAASGEILWNRLAAEGLPVDNRHREGSYASPTPVTDGEAVFAYFGTPGLFAYDFDGNLLWQADLGPMPTLGMGVGSSPVLHGELVIVQADRETGEESFLVALDKRTGDQVWRTSRAGIEVSWSTPVLVAAAGRAELVTAGSQLIVSYDPETGQELWRMDGLHSNAIHQPLVSGDLVIPTAGFPARVIKAIRVGSSSDASASARLVWEYNKGTAYVASNLAYDGYVYLLADNGVVTCLNVATGEVVYEGGRPPVPQRFFASPVAWDGKFLLTGADGEMFVVRAGPEFEVLSSNSMGEPLMATPALAGGRIFIRGLEHLWAIATRP